MSQTDTQRVDLYIDEWMRVMISIWKEKIERMKVVRTGALHQSFAAQSQPDGRGRTITMRFLQYGIYQASGTGRGYTHDNGGDLPFLDDDYRRRHRLDKPRKVGPAWGGYETSGQPRKRRDWYSKKLYLSVMSMKEDLANIGASEMTHVLCEALDDEKVVLR